MTPHTDIHVHVGPSDTDELYYPTLTADECMRMMHSSGISRSFVFAPLREGGYRSANTDLLRAAQASGGRLRALARVGGRRMPITEPHVWMVRRALAKARRSRPDDVDTLDEYAGVKLLPHLDGMPPRRIFDRIAERSLPIVIHAGRFSTPRWIARNVLPRTDGPLVLAHLGSFPSERDLLEDAVALAAREPRVWLDTSGVWSAEFVRYAAGRVGDRLVFGSDAPLTHPAVAWNHVARALEDDGLLRRIGSEAATEIFGSSVASLSGGR
jgi:hypothetical protein